MTTTSWVHITSYPQHLVLISGQSSEKAPCIRQSLTNHLQYLVLPSNNNINILGKPLYSPVPTYPNTFLPNFPKTKFFSVLIKLKITLVKVF